ADHAPPGVCQREHEPEREVVVAALVRKPGGADLVRTETALARLRDEPLAAGQPKPELLRNLVAEPAAGEVLAYRGAGLGLPQRALEVRGRLLEQRGQPLAPASRGVRPRRALLVLEGDPEAGGAAPARL